MTVLSFLGILNACIELPLDVILYYDTDYKKPLNLARSCVRLDGRHGLKRGYLERFVPKSVLDSPLAGSVGLIDGCLCVDCDYPIPPRTDDYYYNAIQNILKKMKECPEYQPLPVQLKYIIEDGLPFAPVP